jgi:hypothetical protein
VGLVGQQGNGTGREDDDKLQSSRHRLIGRRWHLICLRHIVRADTAAMLFWALLASGQINMRKVDGWQTPTAKVGDGPIDLA